MNAHNESVNDALKIISKVPASDKQAVAIAYAGARISMAIDSLADKLSFGTNDYPERPGAIEGHTIHQMDALNKIAAAIESLLD